MNPSPLPEDATGRSTTEREVSTNELDAIRDLIFGPEKRKLEVLQERIENPGLHARDVGRVLPQAVSLASAEGRQLAAALTPAVESALRESVKRDPSALVNAIFPIIGPAIRKTIAETLSRLVQSMNQALDHSVSLRGLRWRLEAARTGRSFAQVVLAHTLVYRVEQVFLIHRQTGLVLQHLLAPQVRAEDAGMVSGMLTAIQDFAQDGFRVSAGETLHTLQIGDLNVWVESSPLVSIVAVIRGHAPLAFRTALQHALEKVHGDLQTALESFQGDATPFELARPHLESCLQEQVAEGARKKSSLQLPILTGVVLVPLAVWAGLAIRDGRRWAGFLERLKAEPGIVVTEAGRQSGRYFVAGLRDPLAADPASLLEAFRLDPDDVVGRWQPYQALSPELVLKRAVRLLQPPDGVSLRVRDGVLSARGLADAAWIEQTRSRALLLPGILAFEEDGLIDRTRMKLAEGKQQIEEAVFSFEQGLEPVAGQEATLAALAARLNQLRATALAQGSRLQVMVVGHVDQAENGERGGLLGRSRAEYVIGLLAGRGVNRDLLVPTTTADGWALRPVSPVPVRLGSRLVSFQATFSPVPAP